MAHPFTKLFDQALQRSTQSENEVLATAWKLIEKGYPKDEVCEVLDRLEKSLIDGSEATIVRDAREYVCEEEDDD